MFLPRVGGMTIRVRENCEEGIKTGIRKFFKVMHMFIFLILVMV